MPASSDLNKTRSQSQFSGYDALVLISTRYPTRNAFAVNESQYALAFTHRTRPQYGPVESDYPRFVEDPMRSLNTLCMILLLSGLAAAQVVIGGTAGNWAPGYGVYAAPFVPLVTTPSVTLATVSPSAVGASNATFGNVAGATNATLSMVSQPPVGVYTQPVWYGPSANEETPAALISEATHGQRAHGFDVGVASFQSSEGAARLMASSTASRKASRTYTNQDVDQVNQKNGSVKYRGKTEHI
jgi:hypothetical protein